MSIEKLNSYIVMCSEVKKPPQPYSKHLYISFLVISPWLKFRSVGQHLSAFSSAQSSSFLAAKRSSL